MAVKQKIVLSVTPQEFNALVGLAITQHRDPKQQAAFLVRQALEKLGLLPTLGQKGAKNEI